ncbi:toxin HipA (plasmid) [Undibacterium sp. KW1]|uniref:type II toxin-antitoxin system HipA family toxin n=1 Tax=Undibacterium sp. KW1 TaxID=2058624 RepID=UPI001331EA3D|nr:HipA domain-containing protein [Undibacterium sp. KW1]BBB64181.1 toxin HipA [Undibacterium sp. KW1]
MAQQRIAVYGDWDGLEKPLRLGFLNTRRSGSQELFEFSFDAEALTHPTLVNVQLDPRLQSFTGPQYPPQGRTRFAVFSDASPDRWGRFLMNRRLERDKRASVVGQSTKLFESDYLLGVHDQYRVGALRFRLDDVGPFLDNQDHRGAPPLAALRELEAASDAIERDEFNDAPDGGKWLKMLIAPGGSLGGARPKASVIDPDGGLWIAKFPSARDTSDDFNIGAWEMVVHTLARQCGIRVPESMLRRYVHVHHTFLVKRFDRTANGRRLHFASAMTLTDHQDGDDAALGASYLEMAEVLIQYGSQTNADLRELWTRIVFNLLVSNTDDHLRNHGFLLDPGKGWRLSEAYDMNPVPHSDGLKLNISQSDNALDLDLARSVAPYFRLSPTEAQEIIENSQEVVRQWPLLATALTIPEREQERMATAFRLAYSKY